MTQLTYWEPMSSNYKITDKNNIQIRFGDKICFSTPFVFFRLSPTDFIQNVFQILQGDFSETEISILLAHLRKELIPYTVNNRVVIPAGATLVVESIGEKYIWLRADNHLVIPIKLKWLRDDLIDSWAVTHVPFDAETTRNLTSSIAATFKRIWKKFTKG